MNVKSLFRSKWLTLVLAAAVLCVGGGAHAAVTALDDLYGTAEDVTLNVPAPGVLGNDETDLTTLWVAEYDQPSDGTVTVNPDGSFTYVPDASFSGTDSFRLKGCLLFMGTPSAEIIKSLIKTD